MNFCLIYEIEIVCKRSMKFIRSSSSQASGSFFFFYKKSSVRRGEGVRLKLSLKFTVLHPTLQIGNEIKKLAIEFFHEMKRMMRVWVEIVEPYHFSVTNLQALFYTKPFTMLQKLSKCEVKAWICWYLIILPPLQFTWNQFWRIQTVQKCCFCQF